jgi:hypothetical protein
MGQLKVAQQSKIAGMLGAGHMLFSWTPILFLVVFAVFTTVVSIDLGRLPYYAHPDPKDSGFEWLYNGSLVTLVIAVYSLPFWVISTLMAYLTGIGFRPKLRDVLAYMLGASVITILFYVDPVGLGEWFLD